MSGLRNIFFLLFLGVLVVSALPVHTLADSVQALTTRRFTLYFGSAGSRNSERDRQNLTDTALRILSSAEEELERIFSYPMSRKVVLRFLTPEEFRASTGAPAWTNAMFFNGEISIPVDQALGFDTLEMSRALRHEYVHAIVADISGERAPAWIDEGLAQLIEGSPNPILGPALRSWIEKNPPLPLEWLNDGFMMLRDELVPVAYAESLFATRLLVTSLGFPAVRNYLVLLGAGVPDEVAFLEAFGRTRISFERELSRELRAWAESAEEHP